MVEKTDGESKVFKLHSFTSAVTATLSLAFVCPLMAASASSSQLNWGYLTSWETAPPNPLPPELARVLNVGEQSLDIKIEPVPTFHLAGTLNKDPAHQESDRAKHNFAQIFDLAVCARTAPEPLRSQCRAKASFALLAWARTYQSSGNPVDDSFFLPIFQAVDLIIPVLSSADALTLRNWIRSFATAGDQFYAKKAPARSYAPKINNIRINNFMAWHLLIRAMSGTICQDQNSLKQTHAMLVEFADQNFVPGENGTIDGTTYDFVQRDSLHYQVYDLEPLVWMALFTPKVIDQNTRERIDLGLNFIKPYYLGEKQHIEFQHTVSTFDVMRGNEDNNPVFKHKPWDTKEARSLFLVARQVFPDIHSWTENVVDEHYDPSIKLLRSIYSPARP